MSSSENAPVLIANHAPPCNTKAEVSTVPVVNSDVERVVNCDLDTMFYLKSRLSIDDFGRLAVQITRAAAAKRPSQLQRLLLAIVEQKEPQA